MEAGATGRQQKDWVDFKAVKATVTMQMILDHYQIKLRRTGSELRGPCPIHKGEGQRTFHASLSKNAFNCFSCHARGNVLDFTAAMEKCSVRDAALKLAAWFSVGESRAEVEQKVIVPSAPVKVSAAPVPADPPDQPMPEVINPPLSFELKVDGAHAYGFSRGLTEGTIHQFGAGLCLSKGMFAGRYIIPLHDEQGRLVGYAGRALDDTEPKYLFPSRKRGFFKSHLLFNLHRAIKCIGEDEPVVIVEGCFGVMKLQQEGYPCVGLLGSSLSAEQTELLSTYFDQAIVMMDGDSAGAACTDDCVRRLSRRMFVKAADLADGVQPDRLSSEVITDLLW